MTPENSTTRLRRREVGERQGACVWALLQDQCQKPRSMAHRMQRFSQSACSLSILGLLGLHIMGIILRCLSIACRLTDVNGKPALMRAYMCFQREGLGTQKTSKN